MPQVTFMRHGQTTYNLSKTFSGNMDVPLTEKGYEDATKVTLKKEDFDEFICSGLSRSKATLNAFIKDVDPIRDNRINEIDLGDFTDTPITKESMELVTELRKSNKRIMNVETETETEARVNDFINDLFNKYDDDTKILVVCHNGILMIVKGLYFEDYGNIGSANLETVTIDRSNYNYHNNIKVKKIKGNMNEY